MLNDCLIIFSLVTIFYMSLHILTMFYIYQGAYLDKKMSSEIEMNIKIKIAIAISVRNEESVIGNCIISIKEQKYHNLLYDIFVIADNCSDNTVTICQNLDAICITRIGNERAGKVGAISELFRHIKKHNNYYGILLLDADDLLDHNVFQKLEKEIYKNKFSIIQFKILPATNLKKLTMSEKIKTLHYASIAMRSQGAFSQNLYWETDQHGIFFNMHIIENG